MLKILAISFTILSAAPVPALAQKPASSSECKALGRITSSPVSRYAPGTLICQGDQLTQTSNGKVSLFCYGLGRVLSALRVDQLTNVCKPSSTVFTSGPDGDRYYRRSRGPEPGESPRLLTPYGNTLIRDRPDFSWTPVPGATHYILQVRDSVTGWQLQTPSTTVAYPANQPDLVAGKAYQISVIAYEGSTLKGDSSKRLNILPLEEAQELTALVQQVNHMGLPEDEKAFLDLNAAYRARGLVDKTIRLLQARVAVGSRHPGIYRSLGDSFLAAGIPEAAKEEYELAADLARVSANPVELSKAQAGLRWVAMLQQDKGFDGR